MALGLEYSDNPGHKDLDDGAYAVTVNVGLITSGALVLGCDSIASATEPMLRPFGFLEVDEDGRPVMDEDGKCTAKFEFRDIQEIVTSTWVGVTKMFQIHPDPAPVVAVTAGLAMMQDRSIASHAEEFFRRHSEFWENETAPNKAGRLTEVEHICQAFLEFMHERYVAHYEGSSLPLELQPGPEFLVGGIGKDDSLPSLYRVSVRENSKRCAFPAGQFGIAWNGQSDAIERFIRGYASPARAHVEDGIARAIDEHGRKVQAYVTETINEIAERLGATLPPDMEIDVPDLEEIALDWNKFWVPIECRNLPLQEAVKFAATLVMIQSSRDRFARSVATVGGRTHIGIVTKARGFWEPNAPEVTHRLTGLGDDN